jgi:Carboxypeptidase regulatory-like domain
MSRQTSRLLLATLLFAVCGRAVSQQPAASIDGVVADAGSEARIAKATVDLRIPGTRTAVATTRTDREGKFYLPNVNPGAYRLFITHAGHVTTDKTLTLSAGQRIADLRVAMTAGGVISGRITDKGKPIGLADAVAVKAIWTEGQPSLVPVISVRTDDTGEFHLFWLPPGRYYVIGIVWDIATSVGYFVNPDDDDTGNFSAQRYVGRTVFMRATAGGIAENEAHVPVYYPGTTDPLMARAIEVQPGGVIRGIDIDASAIRTGRVSGRVVGIPNEARTTVDLLPIISGVATSEAQRPSAVVDTVGNFEMGSVAPGRYLATARGGDRIGRAFVEVHNRDVADVVISLSPRISLSGRVVVEGTLPPNALSSLRVGLRSDPLLPNAVNNGVPINVINGVPVKPDGSFIVTAPPGDFRLYVMPLLGPPAPDETSPRSAPGYYVKSIRLGDQDLLSERVRLQSQPQDPLTIVVGTRPATLQGRVLDDRQQPSTGSTVVLVHDGDLRYHLQERFTTSDASGHFEFENLAPGNYRIFAWTNVDRGAWHDPEFMRNVESFGVPFKAEEGGGNALDVRVISR